MNIPKKGDLRDFEILALFLFAALLSSWIISITTPPQIINGTDNLGQSLNQGNCTAVLFWSETCPACEELRPYWETIGKEYNGITFTDVKYGPDTVQIFSKYNVLETPTILVLSPDGKILARHVGLFEGNMTEAILVWVESSCKLDIAQEESGGGLIETGARLFSSKLWPIAMIVFGIGIVLSPCVAPIVLAMGLAGGASGTQTRQSRGSLTCILSSMAGLLLVSLGIALAFSLVVGIISWLKTGIALFAVLAGAYMVLGGALPLTTSAGKSCLFLGVISAQCSLPLLGAGVAIAGTLGIIQAVTGSILLSLGAGIGFALLFYAGSHLGRLAGKIEYGYAIAGVVLVISGIILFGV
ncbi:MAG: thioredoxin domain-containing protein [Desulfurococcales archaeon]|nr:thioredoxin domain-containing protein [Desulfurococcales archaeon]